MAASCTPASVPLAREYPNFVTHLECSYSGKAYPKQVVHELCTCCDKPKPLIVKYDLAGIRASLTKKELRERTEPGFWKYREFLPVESTRNVSSLGEVCTPLIKLRTYNPGGAAVLVKDEVRPPRSCACSSSACSERSDDDAQGRLPTGSFKARGLVRRHPFLPAPATTATAPPALSSRVRRRWAYPWPKSSASPTSPCRRMATPARRSRRTARGWGSRPRCSAPTTHPPSTSRRSRCREPPPTASTVRAVGSAAGVARLLLAEPELCAGLINDCGRICGQGKSEVKWFDMSTLKEPYRIEGKKTMGLELAEQFNYTKLPDVIFYPTGTSRPTP